MGDKSRKNSSAGSVSLRNTSWGEKHDKMFQKPSWYYFKEDLKRYPEIELINDNGQYKLKLPKVKNPKEYAKMIINELGYKKLIEVVS